MHAARRAGFGILFARRGASCRFGPGPAADAIKADETVSPASPGRQLESPDTPNRPKMNSSLRRENSCQRFSHSCQCRPASSRPEAGTQCQGWQARGLCRKG